MPKCPECERVFDLWDEAQAEEYYYGHDCEPPEDGLVPTSVDIDTRR